jgi:3-methyladenine DNA glycosylase AlkD
MEQATHPLVSELRTQLAAAADPDDAAAMQAYMKTDQPFYGVKSAPRRAILRDARRLFPITTRGEYEAVVRQLWAGVHREEMYLALDVAEQLKRYRDVASWSLYVELMHRSKWWDTLDWIAAKLIGLLVLEHRQLERELIAWRADPSLWVRRASLLAHLKHKDATNRSLLAETILLLAHEEEFFIRKAIGWVLREYAKVNPTWVVDFVAAHEAELSSLSKREALKNVTAK